VTVWLVEHGSYEDHEVAAVYSNEDAARSHCDQMNAHADLDTWTYHAVEPAEEAPTIHWVWAMTRDEVKPRASYTVEEPVPATVQPMVGFGFLAHGTDREAVVAAHAAERNRGNVGGTPTEERP
jgi:hypothetical protein